MSILSDFEDGLGQAIEGLFAGAFRSRVQPVEIAKSLGRAMDDGRVVGVGRVYAPVTFRVSLSQDDADHFSDFAEVLAGELATYLTNHAREQGYYLASRAHVRFETDEGLKLGRFKVAAELAPEPVPEPTAGKPRRTTGVAAEGESGPEPEGAAHFATVTVGETHHDVTLTSDRVVAGRLADSDIHVDDVNASRQHAAFVAEADGWYIEDLGSTNGTKLNGRPITRQRLADGDVVTIGITRLVFHDGGQ